MTTFNHLSTALAEKWTCLLPERYYLAADVLRCFPLDIDGDGSAELCFQIDDAVVVVKGRKVVMMESDCQLTPVEVDGEGACTYAVVKKGTLTLYRCGQPLWERELARRCFSLGFGRDWDDEVEVDLDKYFGFYREQQQVRALVSFEVAGRREILVFTSRGRLLSFDTAGRPLWRAKPIAGSFRETVLLPAPDRDERPGGAVLVSTCCLYRRIALARLFKHDWVTLLVAGGRVRSSAWDVRATFEVAGAPGEYANLDGSRTRVVAGRVTASNGLRPTRPSDYRAIPAFDPGHPARCGLVHWDSSTRVVTLVAAEGHEVWAQGLTRVVGEVSVDRAVVGSAGSRADGMLALRYTETQMLPEYQTEVRQVQIAVFERDGTLAATFQVPAALRDSEPTPILIDDIDHDGRVELVILTRESLLVLELGANGKESRDELELAKALAELPSFPLPDDDLWAFDPLASEAEGLLAEEVER